MKNKVQLITYANRFGGNTLADLNDLLTGPLKGVFGGVHILPFFLPIDGADAGFDPVDHTVVDPKIGDWADIKAIGRQCEVMADVIVNHISTDSPQFRDYSKHGNASAFRGMFITRDDVFPNGPTEAELAAIYRPRPGPPFSKIRLENGDERVLWTTFTPQQVDINVDDPQSVAYHDTVLREFHNSGVAAIRLDAVGYAIKKAGTSCFMLAETFAFIDRFSQRARNVGLEVLVEVHCYYRQQIEIAKQVDRVYDFALPPLVLHAFAFKTAHYLWEWMQIRPHNAVTVLDTHDGIGIHDIGPDVENRDGRPGLIPDEDLDRLVELIHERTHGQSRQATGAAASNLDLYQVNSTFFDAMGRDEDRYLLARAIQFFLPGIPQVYYVGLLAGRNDMELLSHTGVGRDINRHYYAQDEVLRELSRPIVRRLVNLIQLRNDHPAFDGEFACERPSDDVILFRWSKGPDLAELSVDFATGRGELRHTTDPKMMTLRFGADDAGSTQVYDFPHREVQV
jgi:sucrose phosphorylase